MSKLDASQKMRRHSNVKSMEDTSKKERYFRRPPVHISASTICKLIRKGVDPRVADLDLDLIKLDLHVKEGWSKLRCEIAEIEYKRFLTLLLWNRHLPHPIVPTALVDTMWHKHILDTRAYHSDMVKLFGDYLHHFPFLGFLTKESKRLKDRAFILSCHLYEWTFGEPFTHAAKRLVSSAGHRRVR